MFQMINILKQDDEKYIDLITRETKAILCCNLGLSNQNITYAPLKMIEKGAGWNDDALMGCLIIPAKLHDIEKVALERWAYTE